jgi:hypothetical protein
MFGNTCVIGGEQYCSPLGDDGCDGCSSQAVVKYLYCKQVR